MAKISVGQALLILIKKYQENPRLLSELKKLYLEGANTPQNKQAIDNWLKDIALRDYEVSKSYKVTDADPTRRYFETHLAYETLKNGLDEINLNDLQNYYKTMYGLTLDVLDKFDKNSDFTTQEVNKALNGEVIESTLFQKEFSDAVNNIRTGDTYKDFSDENKQKMELLVKCAYLGVMNAKYDYLPIPIYGKGIYAEKNKGRMRYPSDQESVTSHGLGVMKSHMPLPAEDIARSEKPSELLRPADQFYLKDPDSVWAKDNFARLVHPFSGAISGTMLSQLRTFKYLNDAGYFSSFSEKDKFMSFVKSFASIMLYNSGGHTFHEFLSPLQVKPVQEGFNFIDGFNDINANNLLQEGNEVSFDKALEDTLEYNENIINRMRLQEELRTTVNKESVELKSAISRLEEACEHYKDYLTNFVKNELDPSIYQKYGLLQMDYLSSTAKKDIDVLADSLDSIKSNPDFPESAITAIGQYKAVRDILDSTKKECKDADLPLKCKEINDKIVMHKDTISKPRDSAGEQFLKVVIYYASFGQIDLRDKMTDKISSRINSFSIFSAVEPKQNTENQVVAGKTEPNSLKPF